MSPSFDEQVRKDVARFQEALGLHPGADLQMILLKGHLLIEELLQAFIDRAVVNPSALNGARLTFHQRWAIAYSLHREPTRFQYGWVWDAVKTLNALRNKMVHNLTPEGFRDQVNAFADSIAANLPGPVVPGEGPEYEMAKFGLMISWLNLSLSRLLQSQATESVDIILVVDSRTDQEASSDEAPL